MMTNYVKIGLTLCLLTGSAHAATPYRWIDGQGKLHVSNSGYPVRLLQAETMPQDPQAPQTPQTRVIMYSASWCKICKKARAYFEQEGIPFTDYDIKNDMEARKDFLSRGGGLIPLLFIDGKKLVGFTVERFEKVYRPPTR